MKLLLVILFVVPLALAAPVPKDFKAKTPNYCPMTVGDKREYAHPSNPETITQVREITAMVIQDGVRHYTQRISSSGQLTVMRSDKTGVYVVSSGGTEHDPPYKACGPDMKEGDTWDCGGELGMTRSVGKPEKVTTPAGTFLAYPITIDYTKVRIPQKSVLWYADGVGMVRYDSGGTTTLVLAKFTPGKETK